MSRRLALVFVFASVTAVLGWIGHELLFTTFMLYDDEGYVLITLRDFARVGRLYETVYSQYGPFFYLWYDGLQRVLGFTWDSSTGRWITLVNWIGTAGLCGATLLRARTPWPLALFGVVSVFTLLWINIHEPMHPGSTIALLLSAAAWLGSEALARGRTDGFALVTGLLGGALALTKVNVGAFFIFSAATVLALTYRGRGTGTLHLFLVGCGALLPLALMRALIHEPWVQVFVLLSALANGGIIFAAAVVFRRTPGGPRPWAWFVAAGLGFAAVIAALMAVRGTSPAALFHGVVLAPLQHPGVYAFAMRWRPGAVAAAVGAVVLLGWFLRRPEDARAHVVIAWVRVFTVAAFQLTLVPALQTSQAAIALCYGLPLAALFACPLGGGRDDPGVIARAWLALLVALQCLHAYPVAGSQLNWGTFLLIPLALSGLHEAVAFLESRRGPRAITWVRPAISVALLALAALMVTTLGRVARNNRQNGEPIAERTAGIVLPAQIASAIRVVVENASAHGSMLLSLPGSYSLNLWSGVPPPTPSNATHWFSLLSAAQQQEILGRVQADPRAVFVVQHNILASLVESGFRPTSPVLDYLRENFRRAFAIEGYSFWVHRDRTIAPLSTGRLLLPPAENQPHRLELILAPRAAPIARIELWNVAGAQWRVLDLAEQYSRAEAIPIDLAGVAIGDQQAAPWPISVRQTTRLLLEFRPLHPLPPPEGLEAVLFDAAGRRLGSARVLPASALDHASVSGGAPPAGG